MRREQLRNVENPELLKYQLQSVTWPDHVNTYTLNNILWKRREQKTEYILLNTVNKIDMNHYEPILRPIPS